MTPELALELLNASLHTSYTLQTQYSGGEDRGAYRVLSGNGTPAVLKTNRSPLWVKQVKRAQAAAERLRQLGYPAPNYIAVDASDTGTFSLQSELPGEPVEAPNDEQIKAVLALIELQKDHAVPELDAQDWSWYVKDMLFSGDSSHTHAMAQFSQETSALAFEVKGLVAGLQGEPLRTTDIVHGDFVLGQVLFRGSGVGGVIDWDQVGHGDRTTDLAALWLSMMELPAPRDTVMAQMQSIATPGVIKLCAAHKMLLTVGWHINKVGGDVPGAVAQARAGLELLRQLG
jgi:aminoglycoside phosphotransferase (APT) family kinase protein